MPAIALIPAKPRTVISLLLAGTLLIAAAAASHSARP